MVSLTEVLYVLQVDHHDPSNERIQSFNKLWETQFSHDSLLVFSTGRSPVLYEQLRKEKPLLTPGIAITSVGTEIVYGDTLQADKGWEEILDQGWDRNKVLELTKKYPSLKLQVRVVRQDFSSLIVSD